MTKRTNTRLLCCLCSPIPFPLTQLTRLVILERVRGINLQRGALMSFGIDILTQDNLLSLFALFMIV